MTYEEHLDEVTTLIFERFGLSEAAAIKLVFKQYSKPVDEAPAKSRRPGPPR